MRSAIVIAAFAGLVAAQARSSVGKATPSPSNARTNGDDHSDPPDHHKVALPDHFFARHSFYTPFDRTASVVLIPPKSDMIVDNTDDYEERRRGLAQDPAEAYHDIDIARLLVMTGDGHVVVPWTEFDLNESIIEKTFPLERFPPQEEAYELSLFTQDLDGKPLFRHRASLRMISGEESRGLAVWDRLRRSFDAPGSPDSSKAAQSDNVSSLKSIPTATAPLAQAQAWENPDNNIRPPVDVDNDGFLPAEWWREVLPSTILHTTWDHVQKTWKDGDLTNWIEDIKIQGFNTLQPGNDSSNSTVPFDADLRYHVTKAADGKIVYVLYEVDFNSDGLSFKKYWSENNLPASASYNPSSAAAKHLSTSTLTSTTLIPTPTTVSLIVGPGPVTTTTVRPRRARRQDVPAPTPTDVPGDGMSGMDSVTFIPQGKKDQIAWDAADTLRRILDDYFSPDGLTAQNDSVKSQVAWQGTQTLRHVVDAYFAEDAPALSASSPEAPSPEVQRRSPPSADAYASMIVEEDAKLVNAMAEAMASIFPDPRANVTQAQGSGRRVISPTPQDKVDVVMHFQHHLLNALHEDDDALRRALREKYMKASADASPEDWIREIMDQVHRDVLMAFEYKVRTSVAKWFGLDPVQVAMTLQSAILAPSAAAGSASQRFHRAGIAYMPPRGSVPDSDVSSEDSDEEPITSDPQAETTTTAESTATIQDGPVESVSPTDPETTKTAESTATIQDGPVESVSLTDLETTKTAESTATTQDRPVESVSPTASESEVIDIVGHTTAASSPGADVSTVSEPASTSSNDIVVSVVISSQLSTPMVLEVVQTEDTQSETSEPFVGTPTETDDPIMAQDPLTMTIELPAFPSLTLTAPPFPLTVVTHEPAPIVKTSSIIVVSGLTTTTKYPKPPSYGRPWTSVISQVLVSTNPAGSPVTVVSATTRITTVPIGNAPIMGQVDDGTLALTVAPTDTESHLTDQLLDPTATDITVTDPYELSSLTEPVPVGTPVSEISLWDPSAQTSYTVSVPLEDDPKPTFTGELSLPLGPLESTTVILDIPVVTTEAADGSKITQNLPDVTLEWSQGISVTDEPTLSIAVTDISVPEETSQGDQACEQAPLPASPLNHLNKPVQAGADWQDEMYANLDKDVMDAFIINNRVDLDTQNRLAAMAAARKVKGHTRRSLQAVLEDFAACAADENCDVEEHDFLSGY